jgi:hypothetical protein
MECQHNWKRCKCKICGDIKPADDPAHTWFQGVCKECSAECRHDGKEGGKCAICGGIARDGRTDGTILSSAREGGDTAGVAGNNPEHGESRPQGERLAASVAVEGDGKREGPSKLERHQMEKGKTSAKSRKRRRRKAR